MYIVESSCILLNALHWFYAIRPPTAAKANGRATLKSTTALSRTPLDELVDAGAEVELVVAAV
jgi:hypothetical protein